MLAKWGLSGEHSLLYIDQQSMQFQVQKNTGREAMTTEETNIEAIM